MPFVCMPTVSDRTTEVLVQITDMFPNKTQSSAVLTPNFQGPRYFRALWSGAVTSTPAVVAGAVDGDVSGLSAYLLATIEVTSAADRALTPAESDNIADAIMARVETASALTASEINTLIQAETVDNADTDGIGKGNSTASVTEILQILAGTHTFTLPDLQVIEVLGVFAPLGALAQAALFTASSTNVPVSSAYGSFFTSARRGQISVAQAKTDAQGAPTPVLVAYNDDGSLI